MNQHLMDEYPNSSNSAGAGSIIFPFSPFGSSTANSYSIFGDHIDAPCSTDFSSDFIIDEPPDWLNFYTNPAPAPPLPFALPPHPPPPPPNPWSSSSSLFLLHDSAESIQEFMPFTDAYNRNHPHTPAVFDRQLSPPRMHPNLVTTLRTILSPVKNPSNLPVKPSLEEIRANQNEEMPEQADVKAIQSKSKPDRGAVDGANQENKQVGESKSAEKLVGSGKTAPAICEDDDDPTVATVVSLDLIKNRRPFTCSYEGCNKTFKNPQTMKMHFKTHYPGTDVCKLQRKSSTSIDPSANNAAKGPGHNKKIPSRCPLCRKTFVGLYELRRHFGRKHNDGEKSHACRKCGKKFYIEVDLRDHEKLCGEPIKCKCGMKFAFKCNLAAHKKAHQECQDVVTLLPTLNPLHGSYSLGPGSNQLNHPSSINQLNRQPANPRSTGNKLPLRSSFNIATSNSSVMAPLVEFPQLYKPLGDITNNIR